MQTPTSVGSHRGMGDARSGPQLSGESGPDFMLVMRSREYACLLANEFVISAYASESSNNLASITVNRILTNGEKETQDYSNRPSRAALRVTSAVPKKVRRQRGLLSAPPKTNTGSPISFHARRG